MRRSNQPLEILLAEDSPGDIRLTREALKGANSRTRLSVVRDGEEAMAFLQREGLYANAPRPDLLVLDLNMPKMSGREVLATVKGSPCLRTIPVVVLTTSTAERDILESYDLHANCYMTKPVDFEEFQTLVAAIQSFWLDLCQLPRVEA